MLSCPKETQLTHETLSRQVVSDAVRDSASAAHRDRTRRHPIDAIKVLQTWVDENSMHKYPTKQEKEQLAEESGLSIRQVSTWFSNARNRQSSPLQDWLASPPSEEEAPSAEQLEKTAQQLNDQGLGSWSSDMGQGSLSTASAHPRASPAGSTCSAFSQSAEAVMSGPPRRGRRKYISPAPSPPIRYQSHLILNPPPSTFDIHPSLNFNSPYVPFTLPTPPPGSQSASLASSWSTGLSLPGSVSPITSYSPYSQPALSNEGFCYPNQSGFYSPYLPGDDRENSSSAFIERRVLPPQSTPQSNYQTFPMKTHLGYNSNVPIDAQGASSVADEKRKRNASPSASFKEFKASKDLYARRCAELADFKATEQRIRSELQEELDKKRKELATVERKLDIAREKLDYYKGEQEFLASPASVMPEMEAYCVDRPLSPSLRHPDGDTAAPLSAIYDNSIGGTSYGNYETFSVRQQPESETKTVPKRPRTSSDSSYPRKRIDTNHNSPTHPLHCALSEGPMAALENFDGLDNASRSELLECFPYESFLHSYDSQNSPVFPDPAPASAFDRFIDDYSKLDHYASSDFEFPQTNEMKSLDPVPLEIPSTESCQPPSSGDQDVARIISHDNVANPSIRFQCTFCLKELSPGSWRRHEESVHLPQHHWVCQSTDFPLLKSGSSGPVHSCAFCKIADPSIEHLLSCHRAIECLQKPRAERTFTRKDHLKQHFENFHRCAFENDVAEQWKIPTDYSSREWTCGFCGARLKDWNARAKHIAQHFRQGLTMASWDSSRTADNPNHGSVGAFGNDNSEVAF